VKRSKIIRAADLFCGAGGTSTGAMQAAEEAGIRLDLTAVNHWDVAIETHSANHPEARHVCAEINDVRPERFFKRGQLDWLFASPECTHHSRARGGLPMDDQRRCGARRVLDWAERIYPARIWIENVKEFLEWGPLDKDGRPIKRLKGQLFLNWVNDLRTLGYYVQWRIQNAANFGAPTTRERLIVQAARRGTRLVWPDHTHQESFAEADMFSDGLPTWLSARDHVIDWSIPCPSIFTRSKPLSENTLKRIEAGLRAQGIENFLVQINHGDSGGARWRDLQRPYGAVTCARGEMAVVQPYLVQGNFGNDARPNRVRGIDQPLGTVVTGQTWALAQPFIATLRGTSEQQLKQVHSLSRPMGTITCSGAHHALINPMLIEYYGTGGHHNPAEPMPTVTCKPRFGLAVQPPDGGHGVLDIGYRMVTWRENARAQSFPDSYQFKGRTQEVIHRQIGNAVPPKLAEAHARAALIEERRAA
jgi:DNA (cytosine-5)-methyltransferase 1